MKDMVGLANGSRIMVLHCDSRSASLGAAVQRWFLRVVAKDSEALRVELVPASPSELSLPVLDKERHPDTIRWSRLVGDVDGFVVILPKYNSGLPASFKGALDRLGTEWPWKPIGFVSYGKAVGGTRLVQRARQLATALHLIPSGETVSLRIPEAIVDAEVRPGEHVDRAAVRLLEETIRLSRALRPMRRALAIDAEPGPIAGTVISPLTSEDAAEVMVLQRCCWAEEAIANESFEVPALRESLDEVRAWLHDWDAFGLWSDARLIGMVRTRRRGGGGDIGRLAVVPDLRGRGFGVWLLENAEKHIRRAYACSQSELMTGVRSVRNIALYESRGYREVARDSKARLVTLVKDLPESDIASSMR